MTEQQKKCLAVGLLLVAIYAFFGRTAFGFACLCVAWLITHDEI